MNITIERVSNGWIVKPIVERNLGEGWIRIPEPEQIFVYNVIEDLEQGLADILALPYPANSTTRTI